MLESKQTMKDPEIKGKILDTDDGLLSADEVIGLPSQEREPEPMPDVEEQPSTPYDAWTKDPTPKNLKQVTTSLQPTINSVLASMGGAGDPGVESKARIVAAKAVQSYDPGAGVQLKTWVSSQMRQLSRDIRKSNNVMSIPEGVQLDAMIIDRKEKELEDALGRDPTLEELSDAARLSPKRIEDIRKKYKAVTTEGSYTADDGSSLVGQGSDTYRDGLDYAYHEGSTLEKKIIEYTTGYGGKEPLENAEIMRRLNLSPVELTRAKQRLGLKVSRIINKLDRL